MNEAFNFFLSCMNNCQYVMQIRLKTSNPEVLPLAIARACLNDRELVNQSLQVK